MSDSIDRLEIEVSGGDTKKVEDGLNALAKSLGALQRATTQLGKALDGADFDQFGSGVRKLSKALQPLSGFKSQAGGVINSLKDFTETATNFNQFTRFDKFAEQIERLSDSLKPLADVKTQLGATLKHLSDVPKIMGELEDLSFDEFAIKVRGLADSLEPLGNIQSKLGSTLNQLSRFSQVTQQLDETFTSANFEDNIIRLVSALTPLMEIGKSNLGSTLNQLRKIPEIMDSLAKADMGVFADQMERVARAMKPLADEMQKVSQGFSAFPARIQRLIRMNERLSGSNRALNRSYGVLGTGISRTTVRFGILYMGMRRLASRMGDWLNKSNEYVENLHLFRLAMDDATESALEFAYTVQEKMGIDVSEWMGYQAAFQNMARGFGITEEKASIMSKTLTQLGYDLAAVFNVDYEVAMQKLQSAIAGQPRPMREWGFDISETTLKMVAMGLGIEKNVELMTQMEKAQIRYIQLMETSRKQGFLGDMARTIMTPANALRVLEQQILQLKRALGEALIPVLIEFIPYVIAGTKVLTNMARAIAAMMGFELPEIDYTGLEAIRYGADDATDGLDDTTESLKKLKRQTMGFDELNILSPDTDLEGFNMGIDELGLDLSQYTYDFLGEMDTRIFDLTEKIQGMVQPFIDNLPEILNWATKIGVAFASWKISTSIVQGVTGVTGAVSRLGLLVSGMVIPITVGIGLTATVAWFRWKDRQRISEIAQEEFYKGGNWISLKKIVVGVTEPKVFLSRKSVGEELHKNINGFPVPSANIVLGELSLEVDDENVQEELMRVISLGDIASNFEDIVIGITLQMDDLDEGRSATEELRAQIETTHQEIGLISTAFSQGFIDAKEFAEQLTPLIAQLNMDTKSLLDQVHTNIVTAIGGAFGEALKQAGLDQEEVLSKINFIVSEGKENINGLTARFTELNEKLKETGALTESEWKEFNTLLETFGGGLPQLTNTSLAIDKMNESIDAIDWGSPEEVRAFFNTVNTSSTDALTKINEYADGLISDLEEAKKWTTDEENLLYLDSLVVVTEGLRDEKIKELQDLTTEIFEAMQLDLIAKGMAMSDSFIEEWETMNPFRKMFAGGEERFVKGAMRQYQDEIMAPILAEMNESLEALGLEPVTLAEDAMNAILDALFTYPDETGATQFGLDLSTGVGEVLEQYEIAVKPLAEAAGWTVVEGIDEGMRVDIAKMKVEEFFGTLGASLTTAFEAIDSAIKTAVAFLFDVGDTLKTYLVAIDELVAEWWVGLSASISEKASLVWGNVVAVLDDTFSQVGEFFSGLWVNFTTWGGDLIEGLKKGIEAKLKDNWFTRTFQKIGDFFTKENEIQSPSKLYMRYGGYLMDGLSIGIQKGGKNVVSAMKQVTKDLKSKGLDPFQGFVDKSNRAIQRSYFNMLDVVEDGFTGTLEEIMNNWETVPEWFKDLVFDVTSAGSRDLKNSIKKHATEGAQGIKDSFQGIPSFFENIMKGEGGVWRTIQDTTSKIAGAFADMALSWAGLGDDFAEKVGNPILKIIADLIKEVGRLAAIAAFKWVVSIILTKLGVPPAITKGILAMKDGGFVDQGQMFIAREAGPELVGNIGGRTAVANNDQIVESVSKGVYQAVTAAMGGQQQGGGVTEVRVYLDGKDITRSVETEQRDRGLDLMPGGVLVGV